MSAAKLRSTAAPQCSKNALANACSSATWTSVPSMSKSSSASGLGGMGDLRGRRDRPRGARPLHEPGAEGDAGEREDLRGGEAEQPGRVAPDELDGEADDAGIDQILAEQMAGRQLQALPPEHHED